ncbi:MAG TPA: hypothetical protein ENK49_12395 [Gammaproteobacteria bacterium]|nr:hypothetical protein [Gammaproteobacteria bacterium]
MEILYYTVAAIFLYLVSDWILNRIESRRGERFDHRSLVFFVIILVLSVSLFNLIRYLQSPSATPSASAVDTPAGKAAARPDGSLTE